MTFFTLPNFFILMLILLLGFMFNAMRTLKQMHLDYKERIDEEIKEQFTNSQPKEQYSESTKTNGSRIKATIPLTVPEQVLYHKLKKALPGMEILSQVSFNRFLCATDGTEEENIENFKSFKSHSVDFLVCKPNFWIVLAIELDDSSHTIQKDDKRDKIFKESGIILKRWNVYSQPSVEEIKNTVKQAEIQK
ncbi:MAG: DUF2726 domain-containing protein, partial [Magnetococcales bacterium]|nr:DUF2726 domain-containing protein [Magnetococcales bacterium]